MIGEKTRKSKIERMEDKDEKQTVEIERKQEV